MKWKRKNEVCFGLDCIKHFVFPHISVQSQILPIKSSLMAFLFVKSSMMFVICYVTVWVKLSTGLWTASVAFALSGQIYHTSHVTQHYKMICSVFFPLWALCPDYWSVGETKEKKIYIYISSSKFKTITWSVQYLFIYFLKLSHCLNIS